MTCSEQGSTVSHWACASKYPPLPFEYSFLIRNKRYLHPFVPGPCDFGNDSTWPPVCCRYTLLCETATSGGESNFTRQEGTHFGFSNSWYHGSPILKTKKLRHKHSKKLAKIPQASRWWSKDSNLHSVIPPLTLLPLPRITCSHDIPFGVQVNMYVGLIESGK